MDNPSEKAVEFFDDLSKLVRPATIHMTGEEQMKLITTYIMSITLDKEKARSIMNLIGMCLIVCDDDTEKASNEFVATLNNAFAGRSEVPKYLKPVIRNVLDSMVKMDPSKYT